MLISLSRFVVTLVATPGIVHWRCTQLRAMVSWDSHTPIAIAAPITLQRDVLISMSATLQTVVQ
jgi:hypothetical protein